MPEFMIAWLKSLTEAQVDDLHEYFDSTESDEIVEDLAEARPDVLGDEA